MKIAVTSKGPAQTSPVDERFGRAPYFVVHDTESGSYEAVDNSAGRGAAQGAGIQSAQRIAETGAAVLISGHCGPKAFEALSAAGVVVMTGARGTVEEAIQQYREEKLQRAGGPDVAGHWS
ncbi:MAG: NifB/NifX family molybdenum-iron cluster-binding protein [Candidatus Krumholzibacteria bacterium]|nr:NifB/NifX family molybdenum-iron cluster-binding protein [Candidatus Krumholzibacteria bacterium]